jgi:hypothetical protein
MAYTAHTFPYLARSQRPQATHSGIEEKNDNAPGTDEKDDNAVAVHPGTSH